MPKFFFHVSTKETQLTDERGRNLPCLEAAHEHAYLQVRRLIARLPADETVGWRVSVMDEHGDVPLVVLFPSGHYSRDRVAFGRRPVSDPY
jgi:hypothetical protein